MVCALIYVHKSYIIEFRNLFKHAAEKEALAGSHRMEKFACMMFYRKSITVCVFTVSSLGDCQDIRLHPTCFHNKEDVAFTGRTSGKHRFLVIKAEQKCIHSLRQNVVEYIT